MNRALLFLIPFLALCGTAHATSMMPGMTEETAIENADLVARVEVLSVEAMGGDEPAKKQQSLVTIQVLTKGVSAKRKVTVLWNQAFADASPARPKAPEIGRTYRACLRMAHATADFEPVHPDWAFVPAKAPQEDAAAAFIEHTVKRGDTLWALALKYYGSGQRWRVLIVANFGNGADLHRMKPGMKLRVPTFAMKKAD